MKIQSTTRAQVIIVLICRVYFFASIGIIRELRLPSVAN